MSIPARAFAPPGSALGSGASGSADRLELVRAGRAPSNDAVAEGNARIAERFEELALLLEIEGENPFRIRAYRDAAETIRGHSEPMDEIVRRGEDLSELHGIGKATALKIAEIVETGRLPALETAIERVGSGIAILMRVPGLGPKRLRALREELGSGEASAIEVALAEGRVRKVQGFGPGLEAKVREALARVHEDR